MPLPMALAGPDFVLCLSSIPRTEARLVACQLAWHPAAHPHKFAFMQQPCCLPAFVMAAHSPDCLCAVSVLKPICCVVLQGSTTDPSRPIQLWGLDFATDGTFTKRSYGEVMPDPGPPNGAVKGRWRFRPPCTYQPINGQAAGLVAGVDQYQVCHTPRGAKR